jgi:D-alanyl-lipoteichoic acid acyltransferase DltB (MBOAT superfamily)
MKAKRPKNRTMIAGLCCAPLFFVLLVYFLVLLTSSLPASSSRGAVLDFLFAPFFFVYLIMPSPAGILYLLVCLIVTLWAWLGRPQEWKSRILHALGLVAILLGTAYDIWWYATAQQYAYP